MISIKIKVQMLNFEEKSHEQKKIGHNWLRLRYTKDTI